MTFTQLFRYLSITLLCTCLSVTSVVASDEDLAEASQNPVADSSDAWTVQLGGGVGKIFRFGEMPVDLRLSAYYNVEAPDSAEDWFMEFQVKFLFPK